MRSPAYHDFCIRLKEAIFVVRRALGSNSAPEAAAFSKSATVLIAAALERYVNEVLNHAYSRLHVSTWDELPDFAQRHLVGQIAMRLRPTIEAVDSSASVTKSRCRKLRELIEEAAGALSDPSSWPHSPEFGMFMDGAAAPDKINAVLRGFNAEGKTLFEFLAGRGWDLAFLGRALTDLVDARHAVAHAIPDRAPPGPKDSSRWGVVAFIIVRGIESYLQPESRRM